VCTTRNAKNSLWHSASLDTGQGAHTRGCYRSGPKHCAPSLLRNLGSRSRDRDSQIHLLCIFSSSLHLPRTKGEPQNISMEGLHVAAGHLRSNVSRLVRYASAL